MSRQSELAQLGRVFDNSALSNRNLIINGAMQVAQRGTSFTNISGYQLDRWVVGNPGTNSVSQQFSTALGMYYMDVTTSAGWGTFQWIENVNARRLKAGDKVTVSYWTNVTSGDFNIKTSNTSLVSYSTTTIDTVSGWYRRSAVATISSEQASDLASGGHLRLTIEPAVNSFGLTGVQLEVGDTATPFEHRSYGQELALCQRYYYRPQGIFVMRFPGYSAIGRNAGSMAHFPTTMRAAPTITTTNVVYSGTSSLIGYNIQPDQWEPTVVMAIDGNGLAYFNYTASAEL